MAEPQTKRRKVGHQEPSQKPSKASTKKAKAIERRRNATLVDNLGWKAVELPDRLEDAEGFFGLEEVDGIEVFKPAGSDKLEFRVVNGKNATSKPKAQIEDDGALDNADTEFAGFDDLPREQAPPSAKVKAKNAKKTPEAEAKVRNGKDSVITNAGKASNFDLLDDVEEDEGVDVSAWDVCDISPDILHSLSKLRFTKPTTIQEKTIPAILNGDDVIGKASTGSGKTLAFGIPILEAFLASSQQAPKTDEEKSARPPLLALILSPTRELAHQLSDHLNALFSNTPGTSPRLATLTGGLSLQKQQRLLETADVVVGTPGRLWEIISSQAGLANWFKSVRFLVLDEADRLLNEGHYKDLDEILDALERETIEEDDDGDEKDDEKALPPRQTLVFSATFQQDLQRKLAGKRKFIANDLSDASALESLLKKLKFRNTPVFIDVNPSSQMAGNLNEGLVECGAMEKDLYLYSLVMMYPRKRILVFTNSISSVRRLAPFLQNLAQPALALHSEMPQKARLRALEKFSAQTSILISTDVAARGLDIKNVDLVIHYHVPNTADMYVHRSGRTARAGNSGTSILICSPEEAVPVRRLVAKVHAKHEANANAKPTVKVKKSYIQTVELDRKLVSRLKPRVSLAKSINDAVSAKEKGSSETNQLRTFAEELGVEYDSDEFAAQEARNFGRGGGRKKAQKAAREMSKEQLVGLKRELKEMLNQRVNVGVSEKYITAGGLDVDALLAEQDGDEKGLFLGRVNGLGFE